MIENNNTSSLSSSSRYRKVLEKGRPIHTKGDDFYIKHPPMDLSRRAKIFSPFDALKGYDEAIAAKLAEHITPCMKEQALIIPMMNLLDIRMMSYKMKWFIGSILLNIW